ncbi:MAG: formimidoylglutamase [Deltaproteobacteria bacterium]|nr:formimidoylglutamase [Deltaproteobacteria bacterium]
MVKRIKQHWRKGLVTGQLSARQNTPRAAELVGAPDDRGVLNVGGRLGAGHGPQAIRSMLSQFMLGMDGAVGRIELFEGRDCDPGATIEDGHRAVRRAVQAALLSGAVPIVLGGGHDYGYPHFGGVHDALGNKLALINVDAHLDVRPPGDEGITSGSPFYLALEEGILKPSRFVEFGIQEHCNDQVYHQYLKNKSVDIQLLDECRAGKGTLHNFQRAVASFGKRGLKTVVSFDVDAVQMAFAPAVSAPQADGFTPAELLAMAEWCGTRDEVVSIGFFELAPSLDENQKTSRLVATAIHRFLCGLSRRGEKKSRRTSLRRNAVGRLLLRR